MTPGLHGACEISPPGTPGQAPSSLGGPGAPAGNRAGGRLGPRSPHQAQESPTAGPLGAQGGQASHPRPGRARVPHQHPTHQRWSGRPTCSWGRPTTGPAQERGPLVGRGIPPSYSLPGRVCKTGQPTTSTVDRAQPGSGVSTKASAGRREGTPGAGTSHRRLSARTVPAASMGQRLFPELGPENSAWPVLGRLWRDPGEPRPAPTPPSLRQPDREKETQATRQSHKIKCFLVFKIAFAQKRLYDNPDDTDW